MTFDADAQTVREAIKRLLRVHTRNVNLADANRRQAATAGSTVGPRTSGGTPGDPTGQQAVAGLKAPGDIAGWQRRLLRELPKLADAGEKILQDHLREAATPTEQCKCRGCSDKGVVDGACERCYRVARAVGECGPSFHQRWEHSRSLRVDRQTLCSCPAEDCTRNHPDGGCVQKRSNGKLCEACSKSAYRARKARNGDSP